MTVRTFPDACALQLAAFTLGQQRYDYTEQSDGNGHTATRLGAPPRWRISLRSVPALVAADAARWKALQLSLRGRIDHLALHDITQPIPRGTLRGAVTLGASVSAGAAAVALAGGRGQNAIIGGSFEIDSNADGLADGWSRYSNGSTGVLSAALAGSGVTVDGSWSQQCTASALGVSDVDRNGIIRGGVQVGHLAGGTVTLKASVAGTAGTTLRLYAAWQNSGGTAAGGDIFGDVVASGGVQSITVTGLCPAAAVTAEIYAYQLYGTGGACVFLIDGLRLVAGSTSDSYPAPATLLIGDWLQIGTGVGSHLCMVTSDAMANDVGSMNVNIEPPLRQAVSSGTVVTWDKPKGHYKQVGDFASWDAVPGSSDVGGFALDLIEDWRA